MRMLGHIARKYDRGYGHFTTRQNIQYNWPKLIDMPEILADLAVVEMHAIQTSGNCIRNVTADHFAGAAADEVADPRPYAEILRQWSSLHPEFSFLPRKFKIAVTGAEHDRAAIQVHDIGLQLKRNDEGETRLCRLCRRRAGPHADDRQEDPRLPAGGAICSPTSTAILRVYNLYGRRDNKYKARIKILVHETGIDELRATVEAEFERIRRTASCTLPRGRYRRDHGLFRAAGAGATRPKAAKPRCREDGRRRAFARWVDAATSQPHKHPDYASVTISLKPIGGTPGDATDAADGRGRRPRRALCLRRDPRQPRAEPDPAACGARRSARPSIDALAADGLATANAGLITDIIACPGLDYCALANARSIPVAQEISDALRRTRRASARSAS